MSLVKLSWTANNQKEGNPQKWRHLSRVVIVEGIFTGRVGAGHRDAAETADPTNRVWCQQGVRDENNHDIDDIVLKYS